MSIHIRRKWVSQLVNHKQHMVLISKIMVSLYIRLNLKASNHHLNILATIIIQIIKMQIDID